MWRLHRAKVNLGFIVNPFYIYCLAFSLAIFVYLWGWSNIFPELTSALILFFAVSFLLFIFAGYKLGKKWFVLFNPNRSNLYLNDIIFWLIIFLGFMNVLLMGYLPVLDHSHNYREFGIPVLDPIFNTLSIFFSVFFFQSYLENKKNRFLIYVFIILIIQILLFRRSTIVWIFTSSSFLFLLYKRKIKLLLILAGIICIPLLSYCFGFYGNTRSNLTKSIVLNDLGASDAFKDSGINHNHYIPYLYVSSPLANLQKNINESNGFFNNGDIKSFFFYCLIPESFTIRLEKPLHLTPPVCNLITPELIVGSFFMISFCTMGWPGMIIMLLFLFVFIILCFFIIKKWDTFSITTLSLLSTTVSLLIFSNFLNRLDVILMLFIYPVLFHFIYTRSSNVLRFPFRVPG
ncbi:MAG: hypothetical protein NTV31_07085 [Bacteroidia bacterium]|nr:hypothetical protein [Bacteroidia bacterium]